MRRQDDHVDFDKPRATFKLDRSYLQRLQGPRGGREGTIRSRCPLTCASGLTCQHELSRAFSIAPALFSHGRAISYRRGWTGVADPLQRLLARSRSSDVRPSRGGGRPRDRTRCRRKNMPGMTTKTEKKTAKNRSTIYDQRKKGFSDDRCQPASGARNSAHGVLVIDQHDEWCVAEPKARLKAYQDEEAGQGD